MTEAKVKGLEAVIRLREIELADSQHKRYRAEWELASQRMAAAKRTYNIKCALSNGKLSEDEYKKIRFIEAGQIYEANNT